MEIMNMRLFGDLGMEDPNSFILNSLDDISSFSLASTFEENLHHSFSHPISDLKRSFENYDTGFDGRPSKIVKTNSWDSSISDHLSNQPQVTFPHLVSFANNTTYSTQVKEEMVQENKGLFENQNQVIKAYQGAKKASTNTRFACNQDHIIAERKRREKLSQRFIALSALVPGLKKMDKASVLGDTIKYLKQLQEQVKTLEEQTKKATMESVVLVKKYEVYSDDSGSDKNFSGDFHEEPLPEIEARVCDGNVLIRIHCEKKKGIVEKTIGEIEKLHLSVLNSNVLTFGNSILDITIMAQMDAQFNTFTTDLVKHLRSTLNHFI